MHCGRYLLIALGAFGFGNIITHWPLMTPLISLAGALFLTAYAFRAIRRALSPIHPALIPQGAGVSHAKAVVAMAAAFTFLNPHVYLDTVVLLGTLAGTYHGHERLVFTAGAMTASILWFLSLGYGARLLAPLFAQSLAWRVLDGMIAISMLLIGARLWFTALAAFL